MVPLMSVEPLMQQDQHNTITSQAMHRQVVTGLRKQVELLW